MCESIRYSIGEAFILFKPPERDDCQLPAQKDHREITLDVDETGMVLTDEDKLLVITYWFSYKSLTARVARLRQE